jgi:hypothetical protein
VVQPRRRVRLVSVTLQRSVALRCQAEVCLEWEGVEYRGREEGTGPAAIEQRVTAEATLKALELLLGGRLRFRLVGTKEVKAFDDTVAIVAVAARPAHSEEEQHVIGAALADEGDRARAVARAVLNATNRMLGNFLHSSD